MRRKWKGLWALIICVAVIAALLFVWWFGTFTLTVTSVEISSSKIHDPIKIVQLTDLHGASFGRDNQSLIRKIKAQEPDLIVATGDMYTGNDLKTRETALHLLAELAKEYPVYSVNGEHDNDQDYFQELEDHHVHVLRDTMETVTVGSTTLHLYGIDNVYFAPTFSLTAMFGAPDDNVFNLLLAHIPNVSVFESFGADLVLSGDTHGGQVRLPWIGPVYYQEHWFPKFTYAGEIRDKGLYEIGQTKLFISSGLGNYPIPVRFGNRPEIAVITLTPSGNP